MAVLAMAGLVSLSSCSKDVKSLEAPLKPTTNVLTQGSGRAVVWDVTLPATANSGAMEVTEWVSETGPGDINVTTTSVDPGYVMVGGGGQVVDPNGNPSAVDAVLTDASPLDDGSFSTFAAADKDHGGIVYLSYCYAYVIGIKLFEPSGAAVPTANIISHLTIYANQVPGPDQPGVDHPVATIDVPSTNKIISVGAQDNYGSGYGNLLTEDYYTSSGLATAAGKDQKVADPCSITCYAIAYDGGPISGYGPNSAGTLSLSYVSSSVAVTQHLQGLSAFIPSTSAVAGVGAVSTYTGYGRLLYGVYSATATSGQFQSKDQDVSDISGALGGIVTGIAPGN